MFLPMATVGLAFATIGVKWFTTVAETRKKAQLSQVVEAYNDTRQRMKRAVGSVSITDAEIGKLERSIKSHKRKIPVLTEELQKLEQEAETQAALARQKMALAEAMKK